MQIVVSDILVHYERKGHGKPLLLIHGWADSLTTFDRLSPKLSEEYELISLDLPGFGRSQSPPVVWGLDDYARFLQLFVSKLGIEPYGIIGHSNGGALAVLTVASGKVVPKKLVLLSASGIRNRQRGRKLALKIIARIGKIATIWLPMSMRKSLQSRLYGTVGSDMLVAEHMQETFKLTVSRDIEKDASRITTPTLLIYGSDDRATNVSGVGEPLHRAISGSKLEVTSGADHFAHQTHANEIADKIMEFLV